jgi:glucose-6-phosphate isomerase
MLLPEGVVIDGTTGAVSPSTGRYEKRLSDLRGFYRDDAALDRAIAEGGDPIAYEVIDYRHADSDLAF